MIIAQFGLLEYGYYLNNKKASHLNRFWTAVKWFCSNQNSEDGAWYENFDYFNKSANCWIDKPWVCGMGQGQALSLLARAYILTKDKKYLQIAKKGLEVFLRTVENNGAVDFIMNMSIFEEYPTKPKVHVLNGFLFSLFGLFDLYSVSNDKTAKILFDSGIETAKKILPLYDNSSCSYYDLSHIERIPKKPTVNWKYHLIHISLLYSLYSITKENVFLFYAKKWESQ